MSFNPTPNHERCTATREYVGPFVHIETRHHPDCQDRSTDKETRTR